MQELLIGLVTGVIFGFLLQKVRVLRFEKQISVLLFKDMTLLKVMLSAVIVGMIGLYLMKDLGFAVSFKHKSMNLGAIILGGILFGLGWSISGYCPGTAIGALAEGRLHALWAILGMLVGAGIFAQVYPFLKNTVISLKDFGGISLPDLLKVNHWIIIFVLIIVFFGIFILLQEVEKKAK